MAFLMLVAFIWLLILEIRVSRLQEHVDRSAPASFKPATKTPSPSPAQQPAPVMPAAADTPAPTPVCKTQTQPIPAPKEVAKPAFKPTFEITAAKFFSWLGGLMLFLGCVWAIKYAVENNLLSPLMRIVLSIGGGMVLAGWGYFLTNAKYRVTAHTLLGSGLAIIYTAVFCAYTLYHFISLGSAFLLMACTSFITLGLSLKKQAKYVGYLGAVIAFLTPLLLNSGKDAWVIFFLYVFCINAATAYGAVKKGWNDLFICTLGFTWLSQAAWLDPFADYKLVGIATFFSLYALASGWLARREPEDSAVSRAVGGFLCMGLLLILCITPSVNSGSWNALLLLGHVFLVNLIMVVLAGKNHLHYTFARAGKILSFLILLVWMISCGKQTPLWFLLGACMLFAALNSAIELLPAFGKAQRRPDICSLLYPAAVMGNLLIFSVLAGQSSAWFFIGVLSILGIFLAGTIVLAVLAQMLYVAFVAVGLLFLFIIASLLLGSGGTAFTPCLLLSGLVPMLLCGATLLALRRSQHLITVGLTEKILSAVTTLMPFFLILLATQLQTSPSIHWILATTYVVYVLNILVARLYKNSYMLPAAAVGTGLVQAAVWIDVSTPQVAFVFGGWLVAWLVLFAGVPFLSKEHFWEKEGAWIACAIGGLISCVFGCDLVRQFLQPVHTGFVPGLLFALYTWLLYKLWNGQPQLTQVQPLSASCMSTAVLFFLTLIFPLEIHSHWLLVAWATQAAGLAYINTRLPYRAWQIASAGLVLLVSAGLLFPAQLSLINLDALPQSRLWNWYLWVYGLTALAIFVIARLWEQKSTWKNVFYVLAGCILFWLVNIEIAHWFNTGSGLSFDFFGQVAEAITYTLAWALFATGTIGIGLKWQKSAVSKVGIGVMGLALFKFFVSDIWQLELLYRILGAFGLAIVLITASFWYQKKQSVR